MSDTTIINYNEIDIFLKKSFEYEYDENLLEFKAPTPDYDSINENIYPSLPDL